MLTIPEKPYHYHIHQNPMAIYIHLFQKYDVINGGNTLKQMIIIINKMIQKNTFKLTLLILRD